MSLREKKALRRQEENEILKKMAEKAPEKETGQSEKDANSQEGAKAPGYTPMTDEQIKKVRLILWPILLAAALIVYVLMHR